MATRLINKGATIPELTCLQADVATLPVTSVPNGAKCWVRDTGSILEYDGTGWYPFSQPVSINGSLSNQGADVDSTTKALLGLLVGATGNKLAINSDGSINVSGITVNSLTATNVGITGKQATPVTLQSNCTTAINGNTVTPPVDATITFEISGTSTSRTTVFEVAGPSGTYQAAPGYKFGDTTFTPATSTTGGTTTAPETWSVDVPAGYTFRARQSVAPAGGYVNISGNWRGQ